MVYPTGTISCLGAQSVEKAKDASKKIAKVIKNLGFEVKFGNFRVMNICAHGNIGFKIFLQRMWKENLNFWTYEPEVFPALYYRISNPKATVLIFSSGKFVLIGLKSKEDIVLAYKYIEPILHQYNQNDDTEKTDNKES